MSKPEQQPIDNKTKMAIEIRQEELRKLLSEGIKLRREIDETYKSPRDIDQKAFNLVCDSPKTDTDINHGKNFH